MVASRGDLPQSLLIDDKYLQVLLDIIVHIDHAASHNDFQVFASWLVSLGKWYRDINPTPITDNTSYVTSLKQYYDVARIKALRKHFDAMNFNRFFSGEKISKDDSELFTIAHQPALVNLKYLLFLQALFAIFLSGDEKVWNSEELGNLTKAGLPNETSLGSATDLYLGFRVWEILSGAKSMLLFLQEGYVCATLSEGLKQQVTVQLLKYTTALSDVRTQFAQLEQQATPLQAQFNELQQGLEEAQRILGQKRLNLAGRSGKNPDGKIRGDFQDKITAIDDTKLVLAKHVEQVNFFIARPILQRPELLEAIGQRVYQDVDKKLLQPLSKFKEERSWVRSFVEFVSDVWKRIRYLGNQGALDRGQYSTQETAVSAMNRFGKFASNCSCSVEARGRGYTAVSMPRNQTVSVRGSA